MNEEPQIYICHLESLLNAALTTSPVTNNFFLCYTYLFQNEW